MRKVIITLLITSFGISYFFINKNEQLNNKIKNAQKVNDSLTSIIGKKDSIIKSIQDTISLDKIEKPTVEKRKDIIATWYQAHGSKTYSGEHFHRDSLTAAYYTKMGTYLRVTNKNNGKSVIVRVTDRMGSKTKNKIDLSKKAFEEIANINSGRVRVIVEVIK
jgi:rare lipoprotein A